jgi:hypothetical protein
MTTLSHLKSLAQAATPGHVCAIRNTELCPRCDLDAALSPETVLALLDVIEAAKAMRNAKTGADAYVARERFDAAIDAARM